MILTKFIGLLMMISSLPFLNWSSGTFVSFFIIPKRAIEWHIKQNPGSLLAPVLYLTFGIYLLIFGLRILKMREFSEIARIKYSIASVFIGWCVGFIPFLFFSFPYMAFREKEFFRMGSISSWRHDSLFVLFWAGIYILVGWAIFVLPILYLD